MKNLLTKLLIASAVLVSGCTITITTNKMLAENEQSEFQKKVSAQVQDSVRIVLKERQPNKEVKYSIYVRGGAAELNSVLGKKRVVKEKPKPVKKFIKPKSNIEKQKEKLRF